MGQPWDKYGTTNLILAHYKKAIPRPIAKNIAPPIDYDPKN